MHCNVRKNVEMTSPLKQLQNSSVFYATASLTLKVRGENISINSREGNEWTAKDEETKFSDLMKML